MKKRRKMRIVILCAALAILILSAVYTMTARRRPEQEEVIYIEETAAFGDLTRGVTENGTVEMITRQQTYDMVLSDEEEEDDDEDEDEETRYLKAEEVYVKQGQRVKQGDAVLKLTERSVRSVRRFLESEMADAQIALEELQNTYEIQQVEAENTYRKSMVDAEWSEIQYAVDTAQIQAEIAELTDGMAVLEQEIVQIEKDLENGWDDYADLKEEYEKYAGRYEEWDKDNLYTYVPLRTQYLAAKEAWEKETENRQEQRRQIEEKQEELSEDQGELARLQEKAPYREMEARQTYETAELDGNTASDIYAYFLQSLERQIESAEQELAEIKEKVADFNAFVGEDGVVRAESDGLITQVYYEEGDTIEEESPLITYVREDDYVISIDILEEDIPCVELGDEVTIVFAAYPDEIYTGRIEEIVSTETSQDTATVSYPVTVRIEGDTEALYGGMTGDVTFITDQVSQAVYVSRKAVIKENGKSYVLVRNENGERERREVETGFTDGVNIQVINGLSEGDIVYKERPATHEEEGQRQRSPESRTEGEENSEDHRERNQAQ